MPVKNNQDYSALDQPDVLASLFHPRPDFSHSATPEKAVMIPMNDHVNIGACFHLSDKNAPSILFFHGNGEIVSDYDDLGPLYNQLGINFLAVDYRGYGRSSGSPTVTAMMQDCHTILDFTLNHLKQNGFTGPVTVMGRSLGSASALELAASGRDEIESLIIESGFAFAAPLLMKLGINPAAIGFREEQGFGNRDKIAAWSKPLLIIHAEFDHIIPFSDSQTLYNACSAADKTLLKIPGANHNDIFYRGLKEYMAAVKTLVG